MEKTIKIITPLAAILGIIILEALAIAKGINGTGLGLAIAGLAGLGGYKLPEIIKHFKK